MEHQDHYTTYSSGDQQESSVHGHGGPHLCNRCGWPFPNSHPSSKQRRAHKKLCGTINGYNTLLQLEDHKPYSLDDPSDDDPKTPSPKPVGKIMNRTGSAGIGSMSNRSVDDVFSDAVAEFQEGGTNIEEATKSNRNNTDDLKYNSATDSSKRASNSIDIIQSQSPEAHESMIDLLRSDDVTIFSIDRSSPGFFDEKLNDQSEVQQIGADDVVSQLHGYANTQNDNITSGVQGAAQIEDASALGVDLESSANSVEAGNEKVEKNENFHVVSLPDDIHVVDNAETILRGFKDHTGVNLLPLILDLGKNVEDDSKDSDSNENSTSSERHVLEDNDNNGNSNPEKDAPIEGEVAIPKQHVYDEVSNELVFHVDSFEGGDDKDVVEKAYFKAEADVPQITPIRDEGSNELVASVSNLEYETGNTEPMVEKVHVERESNISETKLDDNLVPNSVEAPADNFELVIEEEAGVLDATVGSMELKSPTDKLEELRVEEIIVKQADSPPFELMSEESNELDAPANNLEHNFMEKVNVEDVSIESKDVKLSNNVGLNEIETPMDKLEYVGDDDKPVVKDLAFEGEASLHLIELRNDKGSDESKICTEKHMVSLPKEQQPPVVCDQMIPPGTDTDILLDNDMNVMAPLDTEVDQKAYLVDSIGAGNQESTTTELFDLFSNDGKIAEEKNNAERSTLTSESTNCLAQSLTSSLLESQVVVEDVINANEGKPTETKNARIDKVEETQGVKVSGDEVRLAAESSRNGDGELLSKSFEDNLKTEPQNGFAALENKHHLGTFSVDVSVDSSSQTDSLEGNWGSVSVQSDTTAFKGVPEGLHSDKSDDLFETPAFMTLVDEETQGSKNDQKSAEIQTPQSLQEQTASPLQAGQFPSLTTHVADDSQGRKKNEQIIAKVTNWSTIESGKQQRTPLKSPLGEAKPKSPKPPKENQTLLVKMDENDDDDDAKVGSNPGPEVAVAESARSEAAKEWNSPAKYPANVKSEKRKVKGRPYWSQFVCCSNVN